MRKNLKGHYICDKEDCSVLTQIVYRHEKEWLCDECWIKELSREVRLKAQNLLLKSKKVKRTWINSQI